MLLGRKNHTAGNETRFEIDYENWLESGETLSPTGNTVALSAAFTATVTDVVISGIQVTSNKIYFMLEGGSLNEVFTLDVHAVTSRGEEKNDTLGFTVVAP